PELHGLLRYELVSSLSALQLRLQASLSRASDPGRTGALFSSEEAGNCRFCGIWRVVGLSIFGCGAVVLESLQHRAGCGAAAVQVVPTLELLPRSGRAGGFDFDRVRAWSMHPLEFLNILIPNLFGDPFSLNLASYWGERVHGGREAYLVSYFIGASATLLCLISFLSVRRNMRLVFAGVALIGASLALGGFNPMYRWMYEHVPGFSLGRYPSKYFLMSALAL